MIDIVSLAASVIASVIVGSLAAYMTFRLKFERFEGKDEQREKNTDEWRKQISGDIEFLKRSASMTEIALLQQAVEGLVKQVQELAVYSEGLKHRYIDPYALEVAKLRQSVDRLEKK